MERFWKQAVLVGSLVVAVQACSSSEGQETVGTITEAYTKVCPTQTVEGIDIYDGDGAIDWAAVKASGREFAFIKATQGTYNTQSRFAYNWENAKSAGVLRSAYHFFDPTEDGAAQADHFLQVMGTLEPGDLPAALDVECPDGDAKCLGFSGGSGQAPASDIVQRALAWLHAVENATGRKPFVYTFPSYFPDLGVDTSGFAAFPLWIATISQCASVPAPWTTMVVWQYGWTGNVPGVPSSCDVDRFNGTKNALVAFANASSTDAGTDAAVGKDAANDAVVGKDAADAHPAIDGAVDSATTHDSTAHDSTPGGPETGYDAVSDGNHEASTPDSQESPAGNDSSCSCRAAVGARSQDRSMSVLASVMLVAGLVGRRRRRMR